MLLSTVIEQACRGQLRSSGLERKEKLEKQQLYWQAFYVFIIIACLITYTVLIKKEGKKYAFLWKYCIHDLSPTHISHPFLQLTKFSMFGFSFSISTWVGLFWGFVCLCVCVPTCVCAAAAAQPWLVTQIFPRSGWKHHFDTWSEKAVFGNVPLQHFPPLWLNTLKCLCYKFSSRFPSLIFY